MPAGRGGRKFSTADMAGALLDLSQHSAPPDNGGLRESMFGVTTKIADNIRNASRNLVWPQHYVIARDEKTLDTIAQSVSAEGKLIFDTETSGLNPWRDRVYCVSIFTGGKSYLVPFDHRLMECVDPALFTKHFNPIFQQPGMRLIGHNLKFDAHMVNQHLVDVNEDSLWFDSQTAAWILDCDKTVPHGLKPQAQRYGFAKGTENDYGQQFGKKTAWCVIEPKLAAYYACRDPELTSMLAEHQMNLLADKPKLDSLFWDLEMDVYRTLFRAEGRGLAVDEKYLNNDLKPWVYAEYGKAIVALTPHVAPYLQYVKAETVADVLESPTQLGKVFFDHLGVPLIHGVTLMMNPETKEYTARTLDKNAISELRDEYPCMKLLGDFRKISTVKKLMVDKLPEMVIDGVIHMNIRGIGTDTGRMSMSQPNLQQVPSRMGPRVRNAFVARPGYVLVSMDFSQQELRVLAHMTMDPRLRQIYLEGRDIYNETAYDLYGRDVVGPLDTDEQKKASKYRAICKILILGLGYGMGVKKFAKTAGVSLTEAKRLYAKFHETYPGIKKYGERTTKFAQDHGYIVTLLGRERPLPLIYSTDKKFRAKAERAAGNQPIQGSSADMTKLASKRVRELVRENNWPVEIWLFLHDEIIMEVELAWIRAYPQGLDRLRNVLETALPLAVPMKTSMQIEQRWGTEVRDLDSLDDDIMDDLDEAA